MLATFIGMNGNMGLVHGKTYDIRLFTEDNKFRVVFGSRSCLYSCLTKFQENWKFVLKEPKLTD